jgi:hypothetical protein
MSISNTLLYIYIVPPKTNPLIMTRENVKSWRARTKHLSIYSTSRTNYFISQWHIMVRKYILALFSIMVSFFLKN